MESMIPFCPFAWLVKLHAQLFDYLTSTLSADLRSHYYITLAELSVEGISRLSHRNERPTHPQEESGWGSVQQLHYKVAHHTWYLGNPTTPPHMTLFWSELLLILGYIMIIPLLFMRIVTHFFLNMTILMLTLVQT